MPTEYKSRSVSFPADLLEEALDYCQESGVPFSVLMSRSLDYAARVGFDKVIRGEHHNETKDRLIKELRALLED